MQKIDIIKIVTILFTKKLVFYIYKIKICIIFALPKPKIMQNYNLFSTKNSKSLICYLLILTLSFYPADAAKLANNSGPIIVIDAGHGGHDPGAVGLFSNEKDITLSISQKVGWILMEKMPEASILYTRNTDEFLPLYRRAAVANQNKASLFISIHCNATAVDKEKYRGTESFVLGVEKVDQNLEIVKLENQVLHMEDQIQGKYRNMDLTGVESHIIMSQYQGIQLEEGIKVARQIESNFNIGHEGKSRGVKQAGFVVLSQVTMPAVLVETGFISHPEEEIYLNSENGQLQIASMIAEGILKYFIEQNKYIQIANGLDLNLIEKTDIALKSPIIESPIIAPLQEETIEERQEYRIQIAASKGEMIKMDHPAWQNVPSFQIVRELDLFKYQVGQFTSFNEANQEKNRLKQLGFSDAFIVNYKNGRRIDKS